MKSIISVIATVCLVKLAYGNNNSLRLDPSRIPPAISREICGQFIKHVGNAVHGGLWAEMLQDRKFHFPTISDFRLYATTADRISKLQKSSHTAGGDECQPFALT